MSPLVPEGTSVVSEREYLIPYALDARKRHYRKTELGKVASFAVQLEVAFQGEWRPVVRYDCSHDLAHRDAYNPAGEQRKEILSLPYAEALTFADEDLDENWEKYKDIFLRGAYP